MRTQLEKAAAAAMTGDFDEVKARVMGLRICNEQDLRERYCQLDPLRIGEDEYVRVNLPAVRCNVRERARWYDAELQAQRAQ